MTWFGSRADARASTRQLDEVEQETREEQAEVCVVGAGVAGLMAAVHIARRLRGRVIILEAGTQPEDLDPLEGIESSSGHYEGVKRARGMGGSSTRWAGKMLPLSSVDTKPRPWVDTLGWPFPQAELDRYTPAIERMTGVDPASYEEDAQRLLDAQSLLPRADADFVLRWPKRPTARNHNLAHVLREDLHSLGNLDIWLGANVAGFEFQPETGHVAALRAKSRAGRTLLIKAREYLLAAGTLESTRLLLFADQQSGGRIANGQQTLGRYFNDHLGLDVAILRPRDARHANRMLADRWPLGADRHLHFELRPEVQEAQRIGSAYADIGVEVPDSSALTQTRKVINALRERDASAALAHALRAAADVPTLLHTAHWHFLHRQKYWPESATAKLKIWIEQLPQWDNQVFLSDQCDNFGVPLVRVNFRRGELEERTFRACLERLRGYWERHVSSSCALDWTAEAQSPTTRLAELAEVMSHPAGSTRMGLDPATSVVDTELCVHAVRNLSVASASVFPYSGSANPTFTIMQLALRAADAIVARLR